VVRLVRHAAALEAVDVIMFPGQHALDGTLAAGIIEVCAIAPLRFGIPMKAIVLLLVSSSSWAVTAQELPTIGIIDFYGLRSLDASDVRKLLPFTEGDRGRSDIDAIAEDLAVQLDVETVEITGVCCTDAGEGIVYVGVEETPMPTPSYHEPPTGEVTLPAEIHATSEALDRAIYAAVMRGEADEDISQGHSMAKDPAAHALQQELVFYAERYWQQLVLALRTAGDSKQRAVAAQVVAYAGNKAAVVPHLEWAALDPDAGVRNNATRALMILARYATKNPSAGIDITAAPFIDMLASIKQTDRNKASALLMMMSESRDPQLLSAIEERALFPLIEMCHWRHDGHAVASCLILERTLGVPALSLPYDTRAKRELTLAALPHLAPELRSVAQRFVADPPP
jgi:hypothetical protein